MVRSASSPRFFWIGVAALTLVKLWLAGAQSLTALGGSSHDDQWFLAAAGSILSGRWLGEYTQLTLIKGPCYPLWLAAVFLGGVPLLAAQQLLWAVACLALCRALSPVVRARSAQLGLYLVLLFNPMSTSNEIATRVVREGIYPALALLVVAGAAGAALRLDAPARGLWRWLWVLGGAWAVFWHTREEGIWLAPVLAALALVVLGWVAGSWRSRWRRALVVVAVPGLTVAVVHGGLLLANSVAYGVPAVVEVKDPVFLAAYGSLTRVKHRQPVPRVPVPREVRERLYAVSPAMAELEPFLEGELGARWARQWPEAGGDIAGGWFMWAFRDAVAAAGYYRQGGAAVRGYYRRLAAEVDAACAEGRLDAGPPRRSLRPPLGPGDPAEGLRAAVRGARTLVTFAGYAPEPHPSRGADAELLLHRDLTRSRLAPRAETASLRALGWVVSDRGEVEVALERGDRSPVPGGQLLRRPSPDLVEHFRRQGRDWSWADRARFELAVERAGGAFLVLRRDGREVERLPLWVQPLQCRTPGVMLWVDAVQVDSPEDPPPHQRALDQLRLGVLAGIGRGYGVVLPAVTGLVALLAPCLLVSPGRRVVLVTVAGWLAAICLRLVILALVDVTSFPAVHPLYLAPAYPLLLAGVLLLAHEGVPGATCWVRKARPASVPVQATHQ